MQCTKCSGQGYHTGYACPGFRPVKLPCGPCGGSGVITEEDAARIWRGKQIRQARVDAGLSLKEKAEHLGITPMMLSRMERGFKN